MSTATQIPLKHYYARDGSQFNNHDAAILGPVLESLGPVTAPQIVEIARDPKSPLHPYFDWDDTIAAHRYRLLQAANLHRSIQIEVLGKEGDVQRVAAFQSVPVKLLDPGDPRRDLRNQSVRVLTPFANVQREEPLRHEVLSRCLAEVRTFRRKLHVYQDALAGEGWQNLFRAIDSVLQEEAAD